MKNEDKKMKSQEDEERKVVILEAALDCFLKYGYSKTSLDNIAKAANLSRTLLYLKFKNKEEIFKSTFEYLIADSYKISEDIILKTKDKREAVIKTYEVLILKPWDRIAEHPMSAEFYETCSQLFPELSEKHERFLFRQVSKILDNKESAEVLTLAIVGLQSDVPPTKVLRKRILILINNFIR